MKERIKPPKSLSKETKEIWKNIINEFEINDEAGLLILKTALEAYDRMKQAQKTIDRQGLTLTDRFNQVKSHPLAIIERDSRSQFLQALKQLNLDIEPLNPVGRGSGKSYPRE